MIPHLEVRAFTPASLRLAMRADAFALPTAFEGLAALQAQARLDLVGALRLWLQQGHGLSVLMVDPAC